jgi:threonine synthase
VTVAREYVCDDCASPFGLERPETTCRRCGGLLEVRYHLEALPGDFRERAAAGRSAAMWRWRELLPLPDGAAQVSLGEGDTPLLRCDRLAEQLGVGKLWLKNDAQMPTGSFKDRGFSLAVSMAVALGARRGVTYSSGNAGASLAAYAARAKIDVVVLAEYLCNPVKLAAIRAYGAHVFRVRFSSTAEVFNALENLGSVAPYSFVNFLNPVRHEAMKTYAYEICETLGWRAPDVMVHPVGTGGGLYGAWKGFRELYELGWIDTVPRMIGVQPADCAPIAVAVANGASVAGPVGDPSATIAQSMAGDAPIKGGRRVLAAIGQSGGTAVAVSDDEIRRAMMLIASEGILAEPSAAAPVAALGLCLADGKIRPTEEVVCVITGSGLKQPTELAASVLEAPPLELNADAAEIAQALASVWPASATIEA